MKVYYLRFTTADFVKAGKVWRTPVYDLYDNTQYKNYSVRKANYGTNLLGDGTYTGMNSANGVHSEIGYKSGNRFIDTSSRVDLIDWLINFDTPLNAQIATSMTVYNSDISTSVPAYLHATPSMVEDWISRSNLVPGDGIYIINANRYAYFELAFTTDIVDISTLNVEMIVSIEIDPPVVNGYFPATRKMQDKFPEWMDIREYDPTDPSGATPATPHSLGGKVLNAVAGEWLTDAHAKVEYQEFQYYIETADINQKAWVYRTTGVPSLVRTITGDGVQLARTSNINEFQDTALTTDCFYWNRITAEIYTNKQYVNLIINEETFEALPYRLWNTFDDIGVTLDMQRLQSATPGGYLEDNDSFKKRILDVYKNKPSVSLEGFKKGLRRELNLWKYWGATPDSDFFGATPEILEMSDIEEDPKYFNSDGLPTEEFKDLVEELAIRYPLTWGYFKWDKAYWDPDGLRHDGFSLVPRQLDATPVSEQYLESGVGDGNDLLLLKPTEATGVVEYDTKLRIRGRQKTTRTEYVPLVFDIIVYGTASNVVYDNPTLDGYFTIELNIADTQATPSTPSLGVYYANIILSHKNTANFYDATPSDNIGVLFDWTTPDGYTDATIQFYDKLTGEPIEGQVDLDNVYAVTIKPGHYNSNVATPAYESPAVQSQYQLWFIDSPGTILGAGGFSQAIAKLSYNWQVSDGSFFFKSTVVNNLGIVSGDYKSDLYTYRITLNGVQPNMTTQNFVLNMPTIAWPASTSSRQYTIEIATSNGASNYGAFSDATSATPIFIGSSYIQINGDGTWTGGNKKTFASNTTSVTFSTGSGGDYPVQVGTWSLFSSSALYNFHGKVDENGPWRYSTAPAKGNTNFLAGAPVLTRDDFGIPNTTDYILTWIGVESISNNKVLTWLDTNTIKPAVTDVGETGTNFFYPDNAVVEAYNSSTGKYQFGTVTIFSRLKPEVNAKWNPKLTSGWFHDDVDEYYNYASPITEHATGAYTTLGDVNRQAAPVLVHGIQGGTPHSEMRQVAFWTGTATPQLTHTNTQVLTGNGTYKLYAAYRNIYNISLFDKTIGSVVPTTTTSTSTNIVTTTIPTVRGHTYTLAYKTANSFYVDNNYYTTSTPNMNRSRVVFDKSAPQNSFSTYRISYEGSIYDPATPADMPLNTMHTSLDEGFVYIDHDIHPLNQVEVKISPNKIIADGTDYSVVTIRAYDIYGNPKPNQNFQVFTNFGTLSSSNIRSDRDGFGWTTLTSTYWTGATPIIPATPALYPATPGTSRQGQLLIDGLVDTKVDFDIQIPLAQKNRIVAVLDSDFILADGQHGTFVFGKVEDPNHAPVANAVIYWRKARTIYEAFSVGTTSTSQATPGAAGIRGMAVTDANGRFSIGPFISAPVPGYWFVSVESSSKVPVGGATPTYTPIGDLVYWYEYPNITTLLDPITGQPAITVQAATPAWTIPQYTLGSAFPVTYDENSSSTYTAPTTVWTPPIWYAIDKYKQYQMGLYGTQADVIGATPLYPEYKEF